MADSSFYKQSVDVYDTLSATYLLRTPNPNLPDARVVTDNSVAGGIVADWSVSAQVKFKGYVSVSDKFLYSTGANAWAEGSITSFARTVLDDVDAATARSTLGAASSAEDYLVKTASSDLSAERVVTDNSAAGGIVADWSTAGQVKFKGYVSGANKILYSTGANAWAEGGITSAGRALINSTVTADANGNMSGIWDLLLERHDHVNLETYTNDDRGHISFYQAQNHWTTNQYYRVLDIVSAGGNTKSVIRFLNQMSSNAAPVETLYIEDTGTIYVRYNLAVAGTMSAAVKAFLIDHPTDPLNKDLKYAAIEAPRYDLLHRGRVTLANGQATVDIDAASRLTAGTFAALTQNAEVASLCNRSGFARVRATKIAGGTFSILCEDANSADEIAWVVLAERHDPFIINNDGSWTDEDGRLIPERDKPDYKGE